MNVYRLFWICFKAIYCGYGHRAVWFDSEGQAFKVHLVRVTDAFIEEHIGNELILGFNFGNGEIRP